MLSITGICHRVRVAAHVPFFIGAFVAFISASAAAASSVTLGWDPSTSTNVAGYKVYYGPASGNYTNSVTAAASSATTATVSNLVAGATYYFAATAYDTSNLESEFSNEVVYTNAGSAPPSVALTSPANGAIYTEPATISLTAAVNTNGHAITEVQFYSGSTLLGQATHSPYAFTWSGVAAGTYSLTARLVYDASATLDSTPAVSVLVVSSKPEGSPPNISAIADQTTTQDTATPAIPFTIGEAGTAASNLTVYASSANTNLVTTNNIVLGGSDADRTVTLTPVAGATGTVAITVFVSDGTLTTNTTFQLTVLATLATVGDGTISSDQDTQTLTPGQVYTVTAVPAAGQEFTGWYANGSLSSSDPRLTFVMQSNLVLTAKFTAGESASAAVASGGASSTYNGLFFEDEAVRLNSAGSFTLSVTPRGKYSGHILLGTKRYSFSGLLDTTQNSGTNVIASHDGPALTLDFQIGGSQGDEISGHLSAGTWTALLSGDLAAFAKAGGAPFATNYTLVIPGYDGSASLPAGDGFGTVKVTSKGQVKFVGTLADGTKISQSASVSRAGYWPLHIPLYAGDGMLMSWLTFAGPTNDVSGNLTWIKEAGSKSKYYLAGFTSQCDVLGSKYLRSDPVLNLSTALLTFSGGSLASSVTNSITIGAGSKVVTADKELRLSFSTSTGTFKGTFLDPATGKPLTFCGAVFQKLNAAYGMLFGTEEQTSEVTLMP
jgi:hypothetical protein